MESYPKIRISDGRVYLLLATGGEENENVFICISEPSPAHRRGQGARNRCLTVYERCRAKDPKASFRIWSEELETNNLSASTCLHGRQVHCTVYTENRSLCFLCVHRQAFEDRTGDLFYPHAR